MGKIRRIDDYNENRDELDNEYDEDYRGRHEKVKANGVLRLLTSLLGVIIVLIAIFLFVYFGCEIEKVTIKGNKLNEDAAIKNVLLDDEYSWNSVYVFLKYRLKKPETLPFIDSMEVSLTGPRSIEIRVYEKNMIGYLYVDSTGQYAYIDKDGIVEEVSTRVVEGIPEIKGLNVSEPVLFKVLPTDNNKVFKNLLALTLALSKYELMPKSISIVNVNSFSLQYDKITVLFGNAIKLNEKVARLQEILPKLDKMKGTLHLETWSNDESDIIFEKTTKKHKKKKN